MIPSASPSSALLMGLPFFVRPAFSIRTLPGGRIFISHGDAMDDVLRMQETLQEEYGRGFDLITDVGPVIGSHTGPGVLAIFFVAEGR